MTEVNRNYKDRLFSFIFGSEENKNWTLSLYNAVNGTKYEDPDEISITTIREVLYLGMHNDVSFLIANEMSLYEQQSTYNPNMPLRQMQYASNMYDRYIAEHRLNKFSSSVLRLPAPRLVTFYNGVQDEDDEKYLHLQDSFPEGAKSDIDVTVRMINVNHGHSHDIMDGCEPLKEYAWLIQQIRNNRKEMKIEDAVNKAISDMPDDYVIGPFLKAHKKEVYGMLLTEYNEEEAMGLFVEDGRKQGLEEGRKQGVEEGRKQGVEEGISIGSDNITELYSRTEQDGRHDDFVSAMKDKAYLQQLLKEYGLI